MPKLLNVEEVCAELSLSRSVVYELLARGEIKSLKIGKARRVEPSALDDFVRKTAEGEPVAV